LNKEHLLVFQQKGSAESKVIGINRFAKDRFQIEIISIDDNLPEFIDDTALYLPHDIQADIVLEFLKHPDLSHDLALLCKHKGIPLVASGKKTHKQGAITPYT